ncbi:MAG: type II toxin-antitoxin system RelE/ParE family toxin [Candidatus Omnitrophota bacterium]|nr:type II toxin-antitoxin system RelE/ParE family toxin [Candidatus Omnitrophota bacterium]
MYNVEISPVALKFLERLEKSNRNISQRLVRTIDSLKTNPFIGKKLLGELANFRSLRMGEYRIIYLIIKKRVLIQVVKIAHRREVYR